MGLGNGNSKTGDKGSNYSYELKSLQGLQQSLTLLATLATEGTLISVLNAIVASDQDIEILLVRDEAVGNGDPILKQVTNYETGVPVITYENVDGTTYVPSPNPIPKYVYLDPSAVLNLMLAELIDQGLTLDSIEVTTANTLIELLDQGVSLDGLNSLITTLNSTVATEVTLTQVLVELQAINIDLDGLSLEATQQLVLTALGTVITNTTGLATEVTAALINSNIVLGNITLSTLLTEATFLAEDFATELTLSGIKTKTDLLNFIATALEVTVTSSVLPTGAATEATLLTTNSLLTIMDTVLDSILTDTNAMVVDLAAIEILITNTNALLTTIDGVLDAIKLDTANLDVALSTRATEATQLLVNANLTLLNTKLNTLGQKASADSAPVVLSTEQEAILEAIKVAVQNLDMDVDGIATEVTLAALLLAFNTEDFATEVTLNALAATDFATETTLAGLLTAFNTEDFASQATLQALLTAINAVDFSTETTLNGLLTAFNAEDFATETTLADLNSKFNTLGQKVSAASHPVVLSAEQEIILNAIKVAVEALDLDADGLATETTLLLTNGLLTTIDAVLDAIKLDTANLDVTLSSRLNTLGQKLSSQSAPVVLSTQQEGLIAGITNNNLPKTPTSVNTTGAGSVPIGASEISFFNNGSLDATVNGTPLPAGVTRTFGFKNDIDTAIAYNGNGEQVLIDYMA